MVRFTINASVGVRNGVQCYNFVDDQYTIIELLNLIPEELGGTMNPEGGIDFPRPERGKASKQLVDAILRFQTVNRAKVLYVDGHVDPGGKTIQVMNDIMMLGFKPGPKPAPVVDKAVMTHFAVIAPELILMFPGHPIAPGRQRADNCVIYRFSSQSFSDSMRRILEPDPYQQHTIGCGVDDATFQTPVPVTEDKFQGPVHLRPGTRRPSNTWGPQHSVVLILTCTPESRRTVPIHLPLESYAPFKELRATAAFMRMAPLGESKHEVAMMQRSLSQVRQRVHA